MMSVFDMDAALPALPVPELCETRALLEEMALGITSESGMASLTADLDEYFAPSGKGEKHDALLREWRASLPANTSWLRGIWDDSYLSFRGRLPVNMNYCFLLTWNRWGEDSLAKLVFGLATAIKRLRSEALEAETAKGGPLSMDTLGYMIYSRIPCRVRDTLTFPRLSDPITVSVVRRGKWHILSLCGTGGELHSPHQIAAALDEIRRSSNDLNEPAVGAMTAAERPRSAELRDALSESLINRLNLESIEKSFFTVCLDDAGETPDFNKSLLCGEPANRWFDKSIQIISNPDGRIGVNIEHSGCDASIWVYLLSQADSLLREEKGVGAASAEKAHVRRLEWNLTEETAADLKAEAEGFKKFSSGMDICSALLPGAKRDTVKAKGCAPDAFVQIAFQAAYFKAAGELRSVYEAVSARGFYQGRTECVRPVTAQSADFIKAFVSRRAPPGELLRKMRLAEKAHAQSLSRSRKGLGALRHMSGLRAIAEITGDTSELYNKKYYVNLTHDTLSTSSVMAPFIEQFGFGPVVSDGLGIGYGIAADCLHLMVTTSGHGANRFVNDVKEAIIGLLEILDEEE